MQRVDAPEILDSDACSPADVETSMRDIGRVNRWFGGVSTTRRMVERAAEALGVNRLSLLEVAAGSGEVPEIVQWKLARRGITLDVTLLDRARSHLPDANFSLANCSIVGDAFALPFGDGTFDLVSCCLFAHHLDEQQLAQFIREGLRVSRRALLINDLVRHPLHLALAFAGFPIMRSRIAWMDGLTSVRRAYVPDEIRSVLAPVISAGAGTQVEISRNYLFRMGVIVWKKSAAVDMQR
ncbi:MAG: methyltransferase domain-containing protein [Candidatus Sulfotelmatobacter sp.]